MSVDIKTSATPGVASAIFFGALDGGEEVLRFPARDMTSLTLGNTDRSRALQAAVPASDLEEGHQQSGAHQEERRWLCRSDASLVWRDCRKDKPDRGVWLPVRGLPSESVEYVLAGLAAQLDRLVYRGH